MKLLWCWRCKMDIPMLDEEEFNLCIQARNIGKSFVEKEIKNRKCLDYVWLGEIPISYERQRYFIDMYRVLTGFSETNPNAIWHHRIELYGPDCPSCKRPLRTRDARYCVFCGYGKEDLNIDSKPLILRRPGAFEQI
jgi:hypothetical protein